MPALFLQLSGTRSTGRAARIRRGQRVFRGSSLIFQYYPGQGLQIQPLANFGKANGLSCLGIFDAPVRAERLRSLLDELSAIAVPAGASRPGSTGSGSAAAARPG